MLINLFILTCIIVFIIDYSGFIQSIEFLIAKLFNLPSSRVHLPKPFSCSLCMTFWCGIIFLIATGSFTFSYLGYVVFLSYITKHIAGILHYIDDFLSWIETLLYKLLR